MKTINELTIFFKYFEELEEEAPRIALLNTEDDDLIWLLSNCLPPSADIFLVDTYPKTKWAFDNVYAFSTKQFLELPQSGTRSIKYNIILDDLPASDKSSSFIRSWNRVEDGGYLVLTNVGDVDYTTKTLSNFTSGEIFEDLGMISYKK